eukprot:scaffold12352_cov129-Isochrysis_galbana.AAC.3
MSHKWVARRRIVDEHEAYAGTTTVTSRPRRASAADRWPTITPRPPTAPQPASSGDTNTTEQLRPMSALDTHTHSASASSSAARPRPGIPSCVGSPPARGATPDEESDLNGSSAARSQLGPSRDGRLVESRAQVTVVGSSEHATEEGADAVTAGEGVRGSSRVVTPVTSSVTSPQAALSGSLGLLPSEGAGRLRGNAAVGQSLARRAAMHISSAARRSRGEIWACTSATSTAGAAIVRASSAVTVAARCMALHSRLTSTRLALGSRDDCTAVGRVRRPPPAPHVGIGRVRPERRLSRRPRRCRCKPGGASCSTGDAHVTGRSWTGAYARGNVLRSTPQRRPRPHRAHRPERPEARRTQSVRAAPPVRLRRAHLHCTTHLLSRKRRQPRGRGTIRSGCRHCAVAGRMGAGHQATRKSETAGQRPSRLCGSGSKTSPASPLRSSTTMRTPLDPPETSSRQATNGASGDGDEASSTWIGPPLPPRRSSSAALRQAGGILPDCSSCRRSARQSTVRPSAPASGLPTAPSLISRLSGRATAGCAAGAGRRRGSPSALDAACE